MLLVLMMQLSSALNVFSIMFEETPGQFIRRLLSDYDAAMYALNKASENDKLGTQAFITLANDIVRTYVDVKE